MKYARSVRRFFKTSRQLTVVASSQPDRVGNMDSCDINVKPNGGMQQLRMVFDRQSDWSKNSRISMDLFSSSQVQTLFHGSLLIQAWQILPLATGLSPATLPTKGLRWLNVWNIIPPLKVNMSHKKDKKGTFQRKIISLPTSILEGVLYRSNLQYKWCFWNKTGCPEWNKKG